MICKVPGCHGSGYILEARKGDLLFWPCPACGGTGVIVQGGPPIIGPGLRKAKLSPSHSIGATT